MNFGSFEIENSNKPPSPLDLDIFLPWACRQLQMAEDLHVTKSVQSDYVSVFGQSDRSKKKTKRTSRTDSTEMDKDDLSASQATVTYLQQDAAIEMVIVYDETNRVTQLKFPHNKSIPRLIFKIISLVIQYHDRLNTINVNRGLTASSLYEISKFLSVSNITDVCLDNTCVDEGNYAMLLETNSIIRHLSLSRCGITDNVVASIASCLAYPKAASKTLAVLNLSSNKITDEGVKYLSDALRSNRKLSYLNLADNNITDVGGENLLDILKEFILTFDELLESRTRNIKYVMDKNELISRLARELRFGDLDKRNAKKKSPKPAPTPKKKGLDKDSSKLSQSTISYVDNAAVEKAIVYAETMMGPFADPFDKEHTIIKEASVYSTGNYSLSYLSLAYNNLSYLSLKKLLKVLQYQRDSGKRGLVNVSIAGNCMPVSCEEFSRIDDIIDTGFIANKRTSVNKKRNAKSGR